MKYIILSVLLSVFPMLMLADGNHLHQLKDIETCGNVERLTRANDFLLLLFKDNLIDHCPAFDQYTPKDSILKSVYTYAMEYSFFNLRDFKAAEKYAKLAEVMYRNANDEYGEGNCVNLLSIIYFRKSDYVNALQYATRDLEIQRHTGDKSVISSALNTIAGIYLAARQGNEALPYIDEAIQLSRAAGDSLRQAIQLGMKSEILQSLHQSEEAYHTAKEAYRLDSLSHRLPKAAIRLSQMSEALIALERYEEAYSLLQKALPVLEKAGNRQSHAIVNKQLGKIMLHLGKNEDAEALLERSLEFFTLTGDLYNEVSARKGMVVALQHIHPKKALEQAKQLMVLQDSIYSREMKQRLSLANAKYHNEELKLQHENDQQERQLVVLYLAIVILVLFSLFCFTVSTLLYKKRRMKMEQEMNNEKETFSLQIMHEFRTPLTVIMGIAERLQGNRLNKNESVEKLAGVISSQSQELLSMADQLLELSKIKMSSAEHEKKRDNVVRHVRMVVDSCNELALTKHISMQYLPENVNVEIEFMPDHLHKVVRNLISNAVKFTQEYGQIRLKSHIDKVGHRWVLDISDNGCGISKEELPHIFETFTGHAGTNGEKSYGIGLAFVKQLVEAMKGEISVETEIDKGTTFSLALPLDSAEHRKWNSAKPATDSLTSADSATGDQTKQAKAEEKQQLLVVEDHAEMANYIESILKDDYIIHHANNGKEGVEIASAIIPDMILTDIMMPVMDGYEMCQKLKESEATNHIPIIAITARVTPNDKLKGLNCGIIHYICKPFKEEELKVHIRNIFETYVRQKAQIEEKLSEADPTDESGIPILNAADHEFVNRINQYITANMHDAIDVESLARYLCISSRQLNRKLLSIVGSNVISYITRQRIAHACYLLCNTDKMISDIAQECGFDNPSNFTRTFKETKGCSPSAWRKKQVNN